MNGVWIDEGYNPNYSKLREHGVKRLYFSSRERDLATLLQTARASGFGTGIYWASSWDVGLAPEQQAVKLNAAWQGSGSTPFVMADIEEHDPDHVVSFFTTWRRLRPKIATAWTMEGFQGGWVHEIKQEISDLNLRLIPQCYAGDMGPPEDPADPFDTAGVIKDLTDYGFPAERVEPFHDAARLYRGWYGCAFTQIRLR